MDPILFRKNGVIWYWTFSQRAYYTKWFSTGSGVMKLLVKVICHLCAENVAVAAQRYIFDNFMTYRMKTFSIFNKRKSEGRKPQILYDHSALTSIIVLHDNLREQQTTSFLVSNGLTSSTKRAPFLHESRESVTHWKNVSYDIWRVIFGV